MKKHLAIATLLLASHAGSPPIGADPLFGGAEVPLDPYLQCRSHAIKVYDLPPQIAISLGCAQELAELEAWTVTFAARSGLTIDEVDVPGPPTSTALRAAGSAEARTWP